MSLARGSFDSGTELGDIDDGTSILLTGEDEDALRTIFYRLLASGDGEESVVLSTDERGRAVTRELDSVSRGAGDRANVLACDGRATGEKISTVDDLSDLTGLGMELSALVADARQQSERLRIGLFLCSTLCREAEDTRSVYRFLNSNFLNQLRRNEAVGICAVNTAADIGADVNSVVTGMETSFGARIHIEEASRTSATLSVSGLPAVDGEIEISL
jgi:hypothetical protein